MDQEPTPPGSGDGRPRRGPRTHENRELDFTALRPGEHPTRATFITLNGNVTFPRVLVSTEWPQGAISGRLSDALGYHRVNLPLSRIRRFRTPRGPITSTQAAIVCFILESRPHQVVLAMLPILEDQHYGHFNVSMIVGRSLLACLDGHEWPLSQNVPIRTSVAAPGAPIPTFFEFFEVIDYPMVYAPWVMGHEPTRNSVINRWLANNVPVPE